MTNQEEYDAFLDRLFACACARYYDTQEYRCQTSRQKQLDALLNSDLTSQQKTLVDEVLYELSLSAERQSEIAYRQGLRDGVWLLKNLGVLA